VVSTAVHSTSGRFLFVGAIAVALLVFVTCGGDKTGGPSGAPEVVVGRAPDMTMAAGTAQVIITSPTANAHGAIELGTRDGKLAVLAPGYPKAVDLLVVEDRGYLKASSATSYTPLAGSMPQVLPSGDPWADIDLVRGSVHILSDGGGEVDGASTIGYTLTVDPQQAIETTPAPRQAALRALLGGRSTMFKMTVWIDSQLRLRRIEVPADFSFPTVTPPTRVDGATIGTDVDFVTFGVPAPAVTLPAN
jgi:hypothetical protein